MQRIRSTPQWSFGEARSAGTLPALVALLAAVHDKGNLRDACREAQLSYRYAWGLIRRSAEQFGAPLVKLTRGQGAVLTPLGETLVWADRRVKARLAPILDNISAELEGEIARLAGRTPRLRVQATHGYVMSALRDILETRGVGIDLQFGGPAEALSAFRQGVCDVAGFQVATGDFEADSLAALDAGLSADDVLIHVGTRRQGIMVAPGNPLGVLALGDLARPGVRFVNRARGSGTRMLLDLMLARHGMDVQRIAGYNTTEPTHAAVAAHIASGLSDAGLGIEAAARAAGLDFALLANERYFLVTRAGTNTSPAIMALVDTLRGREFRTAINPLTGFDLTQAGTLLRVNEAFAASGG